MRKTASALGVAAALVYAAGVSAAAATQLTLAVAWTGDQLTLLKQDIAEYQTLHPDIKINLQSIDTGADINKYLQTVEVQHAGGSPADILHVYALWAVDLESQGMLDKPPTGVANTINQEFIAPAVKGATIAGQTWGFPTEIDDYQVVYNKAEFADAGLGVPTTWDALVQDAVRLTQRGADNNVTRWGFAFTTGWDSAVVHPYLALLYGEGGREFAPDYSHATLDTPEGLAALQKEMQLFNSGGTSTKAQVWGFGGGNPAMTIMAPWWEVDLKAQMKQNFKDVGVAPIPPGSAGNATVNYTWFWAVDSASKHKQAAWAFLSWLNAKQASSGTSRSGDILVAQGIIPSASFDIANHPSLHDDYMGQFIKAMDYSRPEPNVFDGIKIKGILWHEIVDAWSKKVSPIEALTQSQQKIDPLLAAHYK